MSFPVKSHHNTTRLKGKALRDKERKAKSQEQWITKVMMSDPEKGFTAHEIWEVCVRSKIDMLDKMGTMEKMDLGKKWAHSFRRGVSNLTKQGVLIKTNEKRLNNYVYKIKQ